MATQGMVTGFGLDLAGDTTKKTSLAALEIQEKSAKVFLLRDSVFDKKRATTSAVELTAQGEATDLGRCIKIGPVPVDIPIDLQGLPYVSTAKEIWELTKRPIDKKLRAMPPFADRIGAPLVRFAAIMNRSEFGGVLGRNLFETYPTAIWHELGIIAGDYKSRQKGKATARDAACKALCKELKIEPYLTNDDDIDAIICAVTAVASDDYLRKPEDYGVDNLPSRFRLLRKNPFEKICVSEANFFEWMKRRERQI